MSRIFSLLHYSLSRVREEEKRGGKEEGKEMRTMNISRALAAEQRGGEEKKGKKKREEGGIVFVIIFPYWPSLSQQ